jgi:hypothetical protein
LRVRFRTKEQVKKAIHYLLEMDIDIDFSLTFELGDSDTANTYIIDIDSMSWANNLIDVAKIFKKVDYQYD